MAADAALVARLEVRLDKFEKQMKDAGVIADRGMKDIEDSFVKSNSKWARAIGDSLGDAITSGVRAAIKLVEDLVDRFKRIEDTAKLTGVSLADAFAVEKLLGSGGLDAFDKIATLLDRSQRGESNYLSKLFDENGVKNVTTAADALDHVIDIIQRAPNLIQAREIGAGLGINAETVGKIREAASEFGKLRAAAAEAAPDLERLSSLAREFDDTWKQAIKSVKAFIVENFASAAETVGAFVETTITEIRRLLHAIGLVGDLLNTNTDSIREADNNLKSAQQQVADYVNRLREAGKAARDARENRGEPSRPVPIGSSGGASSTRLDAFEREERRAREREQTLTLEAQLVGKSADERARALETLRLEQMATREGLKVDGARADQIARIADGYAKATAELAKAQQLQQLQNFAGNVLVDALDAATRKGAKLADIMANVADAVKRAALQALVLGSGPFGTAGGGGGLIGGLFGMLRGGTGVSAVGDPVFGGLAGGTNNWRGGPTWVGENGPELLNLPRGSQVVPNDVARSAAAGGAPVVHLATHIDARGANLTEGQMLAIVRRSQAETVQAIKQNVLGMVRERDMRFA